MKLLRFIICLFIVNAWLLGDNVANFGLRSPQAPSTLPKSRVSVKLPVRKEKVLPRTVLQKQGNNDYLITGGWELAESSKVLSASQTIFDKKLDTANWYNATVPGTVLTTLVDQGVYPAPYFGVNNLEIPDALCRMDWWYRTEFELPAGSSGRNVWLIFEGINYKADIWLNGNHLGKIQGAFKRGQFNATSAIKNKEVNVLAVHIYPPHNPGIPHEESPRAGTGMNGGQLCLDGPTFISSEGWDWVPGIRDRNIGIWQDVHLKLIDAVRLIDPQIITDLPLPALDLAELTVRTDVENISDTSQDFIVSGKIDNVRFEKTFKLGPGEKSTVEFSSEEFPQLKIKDPRLWWPNNYGSPEMYFLDLKVMNSDKTISDSKRVRFGIRELSYEMMVSLTGQDRTRVEYNPTTVLKDGKPLFDNVNRVYVEGGMCMPKLRSGVNPDVLEKLPDSPMRHYLIIKVNGKRIFCKGGNWGMDDAMKDTTRENLEPYFRLHKEANLNMIRNWTGENTEENFYALCDEYGMLVWNDFWLTTQGYNLDINDDDLFVDNARDVVRRFRNHPSIALWNPRNEGFARKELEERLNAMVVSEDGTRHYHPNSTHINLRASGPWHYQKDPAYYFREKAHGFNTEQGTPSVPTAESVKAMMSVEDTWPIGDVWFYHDLHGGQNEYRDAIRNKYGEPTDLEDFCKKAQLINYDSHRAMFEACNSRQWNDTSGLLLWMTHPAWPSTVWQIYSWDYETFGSYYGSQKACEPVHVQLNLHDRKVVVANTSLQDMPDAKICYQLYSLDGKVLATEDRTVFVKANQLTECFTPELPANMAGVFMERVSLIDNEGELISINDYWKTASDDKSFRLFNDFPDTAITARLLGVKEGSYEIELSNTSDIPAVSVAMGVRDKKTDKRILPAYFSDGYFTLMPGQLKIITLACNNSKAMVVAAEGYNVSRQILVSID